MFTEHTIVRRGCMQDLLRIKKEKKKTKIDETFIYEVEYRDKYKENVYLETTCVFVSLTNFHTHEHFLRVILSDDLSLHSVPMLSFHSTASEKFMKERFALTNF